MDTDKAGQQWLGSLLVTLQLGLIAALIWLAAPAFLRGQAPALAWLLVSGASALGLWALWANRPGNFNIRPTPRDGGRLVQEGPYRWIRHPMYTSIVAFSGAAAWAAEAPGGWLAAVALFGVLFVKALLEERWMARQHPGYAAYRARTRRFVPGLF